MKILLLEELSTDALATHDDLISAVDLRIPLRVASGSAAADALDQGGWWIDTLPVLEAADAQHASWVHRVTQAQTLDGQPLDPGLEAALAYGLEMRLRHAALGRAFVQHAARELDTSPGDIDLCVVADDPYVRNAFSQPAVRTTFQSVTLRSISARGTGTRYARERLRASTWARSTIGAGTRLAAAIGRHAGGGAALPGARPAALFVHGRLSAEAFRPVLRKLSEGGCGVRVVDYDNAGWSSGEAEPFAAALRRSGGPDRQPLRVPRWVLDDALMAGAVVAKRWLRVALNASWLAGWEQFVRHRALLAAERPSVVMSPTTDAATLGMQAAAASLGIPSLFLNHGPLGPVRSPWFFRWTATALAGQPCADANVNGPLGSRHSVLVPVGYPPFDALLTNEAADRGLAAADVGQPPDRPFLVVAFAEHGDRFWVHALQRRFLRLVAEALPPDCFLVCKLHPAGEQERDPCERVLASVLPREAYAVLGEGQRTTRDLLRACHVAVAIERCGALIDAIFMARPAIGLRVPEIPPGTSNLNQVALLPEFWKCCRVVEDVAGMRNALVSLTRDPDARAAIMKNRRRYIDTFFLASDGRASDRLAALVQHLAGGRAAETFAPPVWASVIGA